MPRTKSGSPSRNRITVRSHGGILLDVGCGENKRAPHWVGIDKRALPGVDIVHDLEVFPWPLEDGVVMTALVNHVWEHIKPWYTIDFMNELWRVCKVGAQAWISMPYGVSRRFLQDPTHCNPTTETTWFYFDPLPNKAIPGYVHGIEELYYVYQPKPWTITNLYWTENTDLEVILQKRL